MPDLINQLADREAKKKNDRADVVDRICLFMEKLLEEKQGKNGYYGKVELHFEAGKVVRHVTTESGLWSWKEKVS